VVWFLLLPGGADSHRHLHKDPSYSTCRTVSLFCCPLQLSLLVGLWLPVGGWNPNSHKHLVMPFKQQVREGPSLPGRSRLAYEHHGAIEYLCFQ
jgi:hypothetical protein